MKTRKVWWWLLVVIVLVLVAGGGVLIGRHSQATSPEATKQSSTKTKATVGYPDETKRVAKSQSSSVKRDKTNNLKASDLGAGTMVEAIAYYASNHVNQVSGHSWQKLYQSHVDELGTVIISKSNVKEMNKPGTGVAYYVVPRGGGVDVNEYPCYTLENDKSINLYQPGHYQTAVRTVTLKQVVQAVNEGRQADKIRELGEDMAISDERDDVESDGDANHIASRDLQEDQLLEKVVIYYGIHNDSNRYWRNLQNYLDKHITMVIAPSDGGGNVIGMSDNSSGCIVYNSPKNSTSGRPDLYNFGHESRDGNTSGDIAGSWFTTGQMIKYVNAHGGRAALDAIDLKPGSHFQSF